MKNIFAKFAIFGLFIFLVIFLSQQTRINNEKKQVKKVSGNLMQSLESAKNELNLVLGEDPTLKQQISSLNLAYSGCGDNLSILPDFLYNTKSSSIQVCNVNQSLLHI